MTSHSFIKFKEVADNFRVVEVKEHRKKVIFLIEGAYRGGHQSIQIYSEDIIEGNPCRSYVV
jgi:hypothetical protein